MVAALSTRPAAIIGEARSLAVGAPADLVLFDPDARWRVDPGALASASSNTPLTGMELPGVVRMTVGDGRVTYRSCMGLRQRVAPGAQTNHVIASAYWSLP